MLNPEIYYVVKHPFILRTHPYAFLVTPEVVVISSFEPFSFKPFTFPIQVELRSVSKFRAKRREAMCTRVRRPGVPRTGEGVG